MTPGQLRAEVIADRASWVRQMVDRLRSLPLESLEAFTSDPHTPAAAESYLHRALKAVMDLGRHILSKAFGVAPAEYKEIAERLGEVGILSEEEGRLLREMAGYRNRMVHFHDEVSRDELHEICSERLGNIEFVLAAILRWVAAHPEQVDGEA